MPKHRIGVAECFGLAPFKKTLAEAKIAVLGEAGTPATRADLTTLRQYRPRISLPIWLGRNLQARHATITNLFNHRAPPAREGWSVRHTQVEDFRGKGLSYDSHNGTDFGVSPGYDVVAPAPGRVLRVSLEFNRGGLKIFLDHGHGLITTLNHLARSKVRVGQQVKRGEVIAVSGYSGVDAILAFPFSPPHIHMNCWLNGAYVDPFAREGEISLWRSRNRPTPAKTADLLDASFEESAFDETQVELAVAQLEHPRLRADVLAAKTVSARAANILFVMNYYPWLFDVIPNLYARTFPRAPLLDMPLSHQDFDGCVFADEL